MRPGCVNSATALATWSAYPSSVFFVVAATCAAVVWSWARFSSLSLVYHAHVPSVTPVVPTMRMAMAATCHNRTGLRSRIFTMAFAFTVPG